MDRLKDDYISDEPPIGVSAMDGAREDMADLTEGMQDRIDDLIDRFADAAAKVGAIAAELGVRTRSGFDHTREEAQALGREVDPLVHSRPYLAMAFAAALGMLFGLLFAGRRPKVVYVRPRD